MPDLFIGDDDDEMGDSLYLGDDELEDIFGAEEEIIGDDALQIIGALRELGAARAGRKRRKPASKRGMLQALMMARLAGGAGTRAKNRNNVFEQPLPIPPTSFTTLQQADIELRPQRLFRTERLVIASDIAPFFRVLDVKIGQQTQFVASGALPATIFSEVAVGVRLKGDTANLGNTIVVSLQNIDANTRVFSGAIIGTVID